MQRPSVRRDSERNDPRMYAVVVFAAVCVTGDLLVCCFPQLSEARQQSDVLLVVSSLVIFCVGFAHVRHDKAAARSANVAAASESVKTGSTGNKGEHEARQAANQLIHHSDIAARQVTKNIIYRWQIQAEGTTPVAPPEGERAASQAAQTADTQTESPQKPRNTPWYVSPSSEGAGLPTESEDTTNTPLDGNYTERTHHRAYDGYPPHHPAPRDILHTASAHTPLRREAPVFVPISWEQSWQMPSETSMVSNWAPYCPSQYDEILKTGMQQMENQCFENTTTLMLRNLPCHFLREDLIKEMDAKGFAGLYNYIYVPIDFSTLMSRGYGFVNLVSAEEIHNFILAFDGFMDWPLAGSNISSVKICSVELSRVQGLVANIRMFRNSAIMGDEVPERFRPAIFDGTERVPFPEPVVELQQIGRHCALPTTVILKNVQCSFLREDLIKEMDAKGFAGLYNYVYIPTDFQRELSKGYGFVNLISTKDVQRFVIAFDGFRDWPLPSSKVCSVELARVQGLVNNVCMYRNSAIMGDEVPERFRPVIFDGTERVPFPEPMEELPQLVLSARNQS